MSNAVEEITVRSPTLRRYVAVIEFVTRHDLPENVADSAVVRAIAEPHNPIHVSSLVRLA